MTIFCHVIIILEMVTINFYTLNFCSTPKLRPAVLWTSFALFTAALVGGMICLLSPLPSYGNGNGLFVLFGFIYLLPCYFIYDQPLKYTFTVMCSAWIYTMLAFSLAVRVATFLPQTNFSLTILIIQTVFYALTLRLFLRFIKRQFLYILQNVTDKTLGSLLRLSFFWFISCVLLNYVFVTKDQALLELILVVIIGAIILRSYRVFHDLVCADKDAELLRRQNRTDPLTGLKNRISFYEDAQALIDQGRPFSLIFIDLDRFKTINDRYGHSAGDRYLAGFARAARRVSAGMGEAYRISGDEFILLCSLEQTERLRGRLERSPISLGKGEPEFLGFSFGIASYPENGQHLDGLIVLADRKMYVHKSRLSQVKGR